MGGDPAAGAVARAPGRRRAPRRHDASLARGGGHDRLPRRLAARGDLACEPAACGRRGLGDLTGRLRRRAGVRPVVHAAFDGGRLVGGLPLCLVERRGLQVLSFQGGSQSALADVVLDRAAPASVAKALGDRAASSGQDLALLYGLPASSRLVEAVGPDRVHLVERSEAPVLELDGGWEEGYRAKTSGKSRNQNARQRNQPPATGRPETQARPEPAALAARP